MTADLLFRIDENGLVEHVYFMHCHESISVPNSIYSVLDIASTETLQETLSKKREAILRNIGLNGYSLFAIIVPLGSQFLLFATDMSPSDVTVTTFKHLIKSLADHYDAPGTYGESESKFYFESIQKLNNDLLNKTREIGRLNRKLNHANTLLNNRLVKDPLTGLASRYQYTDEMTRLTGDHPEDEGLFCFLDIDDFKMVNDTYGHAAGDTYLKAFARRLETLPFENAIIMRIADDEFGVFIGGLRNVDDAFKKKVWETIKKTVLSPIEINGRAHPLSISLGMAVFNKDTDNIHALIDYADFAMYQAKRHKGHGESHQYSFTPEEYEKRET